MAKHPVVVAWAESIERRLFLSVAELVADVDPRTASSMLDDFDSRYSGQMVVGRDGVAIVAGGLSQGRQDYDQPWRSDGTPEGTFKLADVRLDRQALQDRLVVGPDGTVFFGGSTAQHGHELWKTDGTVAGTTLVKDIVPGPGSSFGNPLPIAAFAGPDGRSRVVFSATDAEFGQRLWVSDGTEAGTVSFSNNPVIWPFGPSAVGSGSQAFFVANDLSTGLERWRTDGTAAGTYLVKDINPGTRSSAPTSLTPAPGGLLYFLAGDGTGTDLWRTDGTEAGTYIVADTGSDRRFTHGQGFGVAGDTLYFFMDNGLWKTRGGPLDATLVKESGEGTGRIVPSGDGAYFFVEAGGTNWLWKTDGTAGGTGRVTDPNTVYVPRGNELAVFGGRAYFRAAPAGKFSDVELWSTDGTAAGTRPVKDIAPGDRFGSDPFLFAPAGDQMFFVANDLVSRFEPWVTDGTEAGTRLVRDLNTSPYGAGPTRLTRSGDNVFFFTPDMPHGGLWVTDGTTGGTRLVRSDLFPADPQSPGDNLVADVNGTFFFVASDFDETPGLWKSDGTRQGTVRVGGDLYSVSTLTPAGDRLFFTANEPGGSLNHVWVIDRDGGSPSPLANTLRAIVRPQVLWMTAVGDVVYFSANTNNGGERLWRSDGTPAGTYPLLTGADDPWQPRAITNLNGTLMFMAHNAAGVGLYRSGGTAGTTTLVRQVVNQFGDLDGWYNSVASNGVMYFGAPYGGVWRSDGTTEGTFLIKDTGSFGTDPNSAPGGHAVARDGRVYFTSWETGLNSVALWVTDGTREGTRNLSPPPHHAGAPPHHLAPSPGGGIYFNTSTVGNFFFSTLWHSDGTPEGTQPLGWDTPEAPGRPAELVPLGDVVLFAGTDATVGRELFKAGPAPRPHRLTGRHLFYNRSAFDGNDPAPNAVDDAAVATDKLPTLPAGLPGGFASVTSYSRGINGIMVDISAGLPLTALAGIAGSFQLKAGMGGNPSLWPDAPAPARVDIRPGAGVDGSDRISLVWNDNAIRSTWLRVRMPAAPDWGLPRPDVFYFGHRAGDVDGNMTVSALDLAAVRRKLNTSVPLTDPHDFNRDGRVNALDLTLVRQNLAGTLPPLYPGGSITAAAPALMSAATHVLDPPWHPWEESSPGPLA